VGSDKMRNQEESLEQRAPDESGGAGSSRPRALPKGLYAHFLLIDIASPVREIRGVPRYLPIKETPTFLGRNESAQILLDDPWTVDLWHAKVELHEADGKMLFVIYPVEKSRVAVNGAMVGKSGYSLQSEDMIQIGSAQLIFFQRDIHAAPIYRQ
jgi:hypothetical protein